MVAMAVIRSPLMTDTEVVRAASSRQIAEDVIRYIANQRDFTKMYQVRLNLDPEPEVPDRVLLRFLSSLHTEDRQGSVQVEEHPQRAGRRRAQAGADPGGEE
jgi:hypothetical protein